MQQPKIILGISGGIAAYKTPELVRRLKERGADVQVVMTRAAREFVTATALQAVSGRQVRDDLWDEDAEAAMGHIELARWADLVLIAPATANIMARLASGSASDLLTTLCLATTAPVVVAPAMNHVMWGHAAVRENRQTLARRGVRILGPADGDQACGETGPGRMLEPGDIVAAVLAPVALPGGQAPLAGRSVMITAGPTREAIDPVRFISNRSSGKMGYALAEAARDAGARVTLISGPVALPVPGGVECLHVESAQEMFAATHAHIAAIDIFIAAAAVSDYHAADVKPAKIKKNDARMSIDLVKSPDILASVAKLADRPFTVGFAAETDRLREYALGKLENKKLNMIVANMVGANCGFDANDNAVDVYWGGGEASLAKKDKSLLARELIALIAERYRQGIDAKSSSVADAALSAVAARD